FIYTVIPELFEATFLRKYPKCERFHHWRRINFSDSEYANIRIFLMPWDTIGPTSLRRPETPFSGTRPPIFTPISSESVTH
ncbi:MAG: hypothetical protein QNK18_11425, partial [Gammaproteobacteria bacterium]|nr:hypothetical protein [Gammaproteobacteria bacterium]